MDPLKFQPTFGFPCVFSPTETGLAIEDIWPSLHIGADRVPEMRRKISRLPWAKQAYQRWLAEAEIVIKENPAFSRRMDGGRSGSDGRDGMFTPQGHYLSFDPQQCFPVWNPYNAEWMEKSDRYEGAWMLLQHERLRRLISSMGFLWKLSGDKRFAHWAWKGLKDLTALYEETAAVLDIEKEKHRFVYGGLYEAQAQLQTVQALELLEDVPGYREASIAVREKVITPGCESLSRWMKVMMVFNMSVWGMSALVEAGRLLKCNDWMQQALHDNRAGLQAMLRNGVRAHEKTGKPDGLWFEHSTFYANFYVITAIIPLVRAGEKAGLMNKDLRKHFAAFFDAPPHLADSELRLLALADRFGPDHARLSQMHYLYEYAAGQVDKKHAPLLSLLYQHCGAPRHTLAALAFGPDRLPDPKIPVALQKSCVLPEAGLTTFRAKTSKGNVTLWFNALKRYPGSAQGHHHMDRLSISLHAWNEIISSDIGRLGNEGKDSPRWAYTTSTFCHNTLMLDEYDQSAMDRVSFETKLDSKIPRTRASFRGNWSDKQNDTFRHHHHGRLKENLYDDALISRTVWFDFPYIILFDELDAKTEKRFGFAFHSRGAMKVHCSKNSAQPLQLPELPNEGSWILFTGRASADPVERLVADWRISSNVYLRSITTSDDTFDAHWGTTPDNPNHIRRGTIYLRAPGKKRSFATILEVHSGTPTIRGIKLDSKKSISIDFHNQKTKIYSLPKLK